MYHIECDKRGCKRPVYYVDSGCEGIEQSLCKKHGDNYIIKESLPGRINYLKREIRKTIKELKCQTSEEGHVFPPPPKPKLNSNGDELIFDVATSGSLNFMTGTPHTCTKCGYTYYDPSGILNISDVSFNVADTMKKIDVPELICNIPEVGQK